MKANQIIHEVVILDASSSMKPHKHAVVKVTDALIGQLAAQVVTFPEQETRVTVYAFSSQDYLGGRAYQCLIWDKDVLRIPSIAGLYDPAGNTALTATVMQVIDDLKKIPVMYGDNTFLVYLVTDGQENWSHLAGNRGLEQWQQANEQLPGVIAGLGDSWTLAGLVPGMSAKHSLVRFGWASGNVEVWDPSRREGVEEMGERIRISSDTYSGLRSRGVRSTTSLFMMNAPPAAELKRTLTPMTPGSCYFEEVTAHDLEKITRGRLDQFMALKTGKPYSPGDPVTFYQMDRRVRIQKNKRLAVAIPDHGSKTTVDVYTGTGVREKLGLPDDRDVRVSPAKWPDYRVFVESTSLNRRLYPDTSVLVMR